MFGRDLLNLHRQVNSLFSAMGSQYFDDDFLALDPFQPARAQAQPRLTEGQGQGVQGKDESALRGRGSEALTSRGKTEPSLLAPLFGSQFPSLLSMSVDVNASDNAYTISCDLPGVDKQSIDIEADKSTSTLTIKAEKRQEITETEAEPPTATSQTQERKAQGQTPTQGQAQGTGQELSKTSETGTAVGRPRVLRQERVYGMVQRSLRLANDADLDHIEAKYENGVLKLRVPRMQRTEQTKKARKVAVQ